MIDIVLNSGKPVTGVIGDTLNGMSYIIATVYIHGVVLPKKIPIGSPFFALQNLITLGFSLSPVVCISSHSDDELE